MKKLKLTKIIASTLIVASVLALNPIGASAEVKQDNTGAVIQETVLATIGNEKITKGDLDKEISKYDAQLKQQYGDDYATNVHDVISKIKKQQLENLVIQNILLQKANELKLKPSDDGINSKIDELINEYKAQYPGVGEFESVLKENSLTEDELKELLKTNIIISAVQDYMLKDVTVTDDEVQKYYSENKDTQFVVGAGATVAHILVADEATAKSLKAKLDAGADFATLAKENSIDPGSKDKGGSLGFVAYNSTQLITEFMNGFKNLKEGEVSAPVKSQYGYHLIKTTGLKASEVIPFNKVKDEIKTSLLQQKQADTFNSKVTEWKTDLNVIIYEDKL